MAKAAEQKSVPSLFAHVRVKFPASLHRAQPSAIGIVSDVVSGQAVVCVLPSRHMSLTSVTVAHRSQAKDTEGWWEAYDG